MIFFETRTLYDVYIELLEICVARDFGSLT